MQIKVGQRWIPKEHSVFDYSLIIKSVSEEDKRVSFLYGETLKPVIKVPFWQLYEDFELDHSYEAQLKFDEDLERLLDE